MSRYIHYTEQQKEQARKTDLVVLLQNEGEILKRSGGEYQWRDGSDKVTVRGNLWFHQYEQKGGDAIDFVRRFYHKNYQEAMEYLLGGCRKEFILSPSVIREKENFKLPERNDNMRRIFAYLLGKRGIDREVLLAFVSRKMIYESANYHNAVFVGFDTKGVPQHASMRGTGSESVFKGNAPNSMPEYSFHWIGKSDKIYLFESPIDMLSFISRNKEDWRKHSYAAACSVSDKVLFQCLKDYPNLKHVYLCFDHDDPGQTAAKRIKDKLCTLDIKSQILIPTLKDWNEDLSIETEGRGKELCQEL